MEVNSGVLSKVLERDIKDGHFDVPFGVKEIGAGAFRNCWSLKTISLPKSVEVIRENAFWGCRNLYSIEIPSSVKTINQYAFSGCEDLTKLTLNEGLEEIYQGSFANCYSLKSVIIPNSVKFIGASAFSGCSKLKTVSLPKSLEDISNATFNYCYKLKNIKIPSSVKTIGPSAFSSCYDLRHIYIPDSVKKIHKNAFDSCGELRSVRLSKSINVIDEKTFAYCSKLTHINIPSSVKLIKKLAFASCESLKHISIPDNTTSIESFAFSSCKKLKSVKIGNSVQTIGHNVFENTAIKSITLPESLHRMESNVFLNCENLISAYINGSIKELPEGTFKCCLNLESVILPDSLKEIGNSAFYRCLKITNISIPNKVTSIDNFAFFNCSALENINLPSTLTSLGISAFEGCSSLVNIEIPSSIKQIREKTFFECSSLENIRLFSGLEVIGDSAISHCFELKSLEIPDTVHTIGKASFEITEQLDSLFIPSSVQNIGEIPGIQPQFYSKTDKGFHFTSNLYNGYTSMTGIKVNISILCSNPKYFDSIVKEQRNEYIANFYNKVFANFPSKTQKDEFLEKHNYTFFKQITSKHKINSIGAFNFMYNVGGFTTPVEYKGKKVDYAQKIMGFILEKLDKKQIDANTLTAIGSPMKDYKFKKEFSDFFMEHFDELIKEEKEKRGFIAQCYNEFELVQETNTSNRGSQRQLKPTVPKFKDYFLEHKFTGIDSPEARDIAVTIAPYFGGQHTFNNAVSIMQEKLLNGVPNHILSTPLKEGQSPFSEVDELESKIRTNQANFLNNGLYVANNEFSYEWLAKNDPNNLIIGKLCSCCAHLMGVGYGIMKASIIHPSVQNLVIRNSYNRIIAKSTLYVNTAHGYGILNNFEISEYVPNRKINSKLTTYDLIYDKFILGINDFARQYNLENPNNPLLKINVGMGFNDLEDIITKHHKQETNLLRPINYAYYGDDSTNHRGDSYNEQYILWEKPEFEDVSLKANSQNGEVVTGYGDVNMNETETLRDEEKTPIDEENEDEYISAAHDSPNTIQVFRLGQNGDYIINDISPISSDIIDENSNSNNEHNADKNLDKNSHGNDNQPEI